MQQAERSNPMITNPTPEPPTILPPNPDRASIMAWRKAERARLIEARMALPAEMRQAASEAIANKLETMMGDVTGKAVSLYWPFRGEPDLRPLAGRIWARGGRALLPVVVEKGQPLIFKPWRQGDPLVKGVWNIPIPDTEETALPDVALAPVIGFDAHHYRLGYGGGFFDRTLAKLRDEGRMPRILGVGYRMQQIPTIHPLPHDIAMAAVVTE